MFDKDNNPFQDYEVVVGLEVHAQLSTKSKIYSSDSAEFGASPNTQINEITLGHPGSLPVLNKVAVEYAVRMGLATNCEIRRENQFARKNYFYADLPKGYQITQHTTPICFHGYIYLELSAENQKKIGITRIHLEEDAGKSMHDQDLRDSLIDLNRAGVPLIEIVSEPDLRSAEEAGLYLTEIRKILRYLNICDGNMEEGSMRCDANISVRKIGDPNLGNRCEVKNLNSIRNVQKAIEFETKRQINILEKGGKIEQNTLNFDALSGATSVLRSKEMANDYRYFPEPDLPPLLLSEAYIQEVHQSMPMLPKEWLEKLTKEYNLSVVEASILIEHRDIANYFLELSEEIKEFTNPKIAYNWLLGPIKSYLNESGISMSDFPISVPKLGEIIQLVETNKVNYSMAISGILPKIMKEPHLDPGKIAEEDQLYINTGENELETYIETIIKKYPEKVLEYQGGKKGIAGLFMGEIMKLSKGKIDPKLANNLLIETLDSFRSN